MTWQSCLGKRSAFWHAGRRYASCSRKPSPPSLPLFPRQRESPACATNSTPAACLSALRAAKPIAPPAPLAACLEGGLVHLLGDRVPPQVIAIVRVEQLLQPAGGMQQGHSSVGKQESSSKRAGSVCWHTPGHTAAACRRGATRHGPVCYAGHTALESPQTACCRLSTGAALRATITHAC